MTSARTALCSVASLFILVPTALAQGDPETIAKIIDEGKNRSQVWQHLEYLSHEIGPRLTGSTGLDRANAWTRDQFAAFGCKNAHLHKWGEVPVRFDRGPGHVKMIKPVEQTFEFTARSWSAGTNGPVSGPVIKQPKTMEELEAMRDQLNGAWVLSKSQPRGRRRGVVQEGSVPDPQEQIIKAMIEAGIAGRILAANNDLVVTGGERGWREMKFNELPKDVAVTIRRADYDALNSRLADGEEVVVEVDMQHHFTEGPFPVFNTIAEIPGTDFPEQVVIVSAHLDSWDGFGSQGAQDNGTGSSVTLECARILNAVGAKPRRTIRFILWSGEEQGLLGSRAYVDSLTDEEKANISAVLVDDGGTNYEGGLVCVEQMSEMLTLATAPVNAAFPDMPVKITVRERMPRGGGSDHASFNSAGIPGFFWDEAGSGGREGKNYTFVHHTQHDTTRYAVPEYLVQSATCAAVTAYNLAMADTMLPRYVAPPESAEPKPDDSAPFTITQGPLTGAWDAQFTGENASSRTFTLVFEHSSEGGIRGASLSERGDTRLAKITFDSAAGALSFVISSEFMGTLDYKATVAGNEMTGTLSRGDEFSRTFKATRDPNVKPEPVVKPAPAADSPVDVATPPSNAESGAAAETPAPGGVKEG